MALHAGLSAADVVGVGMLLVGGLVLAVSARYVWRAAAVHRASTVAAVTAADPGTLVRVDGETVAEQAPLTAPFSGDDCVALRYAVEERRLSPALLPWNVVLHETAGGDAFGVRTDAGVVSVVAPARTVTLAASTVASVGATDTPTERIERFERTVDGLPRSTVWRDPPSLFAPVARALSLGTRRYREACLRPGDGVTVVGRVADERAGVDPVVVSDRSPARTFIRMSKTSLAGLAVGLCGLAVGALVLVG
jgi:hypothetical protein